MPFLHAVHIVLLLEKNPMQKFKVAFNIIQKVYDDLKFLLKSSEVLLVSS